MRLVFVRRWVAGSWLARPLVFGYRIVLFCRVLASVFADGLNWLWKSREHTNFTYAITARNERQLAWFVSEITGSDVETVEGYFRELHEDADLRDALRGAAASARRRGLIDVEPQYGRRVAWYALLRIIKPQCVVESGIDKGLGTMVLASAMRRNDVEGAKGELIGLDINPECGALLVSPYATYVEVRLGDSVQSLTRMSSRVDVFLHDSDHTYAHERAELAAVAGQLSDDALTLSDASSESNALDDFAREAGMAFLYFREEPVRRFHSPQGLGIARRRSA